MAISVKFLVLVMAMTAELQTSAAKTIFAHMVNTPAAVRWGLAEGANGVEMDLQFNGNTPSIFKHSTGGAPCDCTCLCAIGSLCPTTNVCRKLWSETGSHCTASSTAEDMTLALGGTDVRAKLAVIYIDSKLTNSMTNYVAAGAAVVNLLNRNVFARGYQGQVIINGAKTIYADYLKGALQAAKASPYANKYFYTFDFEADDSYKVWAELIRLGTNNIVYSTGISVCAPGNYSDAIKISVAKNNYASVGVWTLQDSKSMKIYLSNGADAIMTNSPSVALDLIGAQNLALPGQALVPKTVPNPAPATWECDCNYHRGGCTISKLPPANAACKCTYKGAWTCGGHTWDCKDLNNPNCRNPQYNKDTCNQGGGDCGGY